MLNTSSPTPERLSAITPRNCVKSFCLGGNRVMLVSFDANGDVFERYEGPRWLVTELKLQVMTDNLAKVGPSTVQLVP